MDTDAIRRAWPNVLGRIFTMRRITWTFVSQNAQVMAFDGNKLTLGIATAGLTQTFRAGNHSDIVRQALIDELGVDAIVDGVHMDAVSQQAPVAPPPGSVPVGLPDPPSKGEPASPADSGQSGQGGAPQDSPGAGRSSWGDAGAGHESAGAGSNASNGTGGTGGGAGASASGSRGATALADAGLSPVAGRSLQDNAGWGSATGPAPDWATGPSAAAPAAASGGAPAGAAPTAASSTTEAPTDSAVRGASAVRQSFAQARSRAGGPRSADDQPRQPVTDDSAVSDDDEDIEQSGDVGRSVIEKVLGGRVVQELEN